MLSSAGNLRWHDVYFAFPVGAIRLTFGTAASSFEYAWVHGLQHRNVDGGRRLGSLPSDHEHAL
eukprot:CAMPEP_0117615162 /NCGR_PEP_ID=MMETSP0784-20121206/84402_1 /TAXON_ID=39447 /ORGANISM="" /LENGTH=63 /DNA_ID=CAMNT_0005418899 /DNA_START=8 /DNA_END=199 /DNA_ORIENTATION=-